MGASISVDGDETGSSLNTSTHDLSARMQAGFILLDKHPGPTSHQLTAWVRELLELPRLAHGGTLDPFASGVLPLLLGRAMKLTPMVLEHQKSYIGLLRTAEPVERELLESRLRMFQGRIYNVPPDVSAVKVQVRTRRITEIELLDLEGTDALVSIDCEAGTYVRTLARDLGLMLDQRCELVELRRSRSGIFGATSCVSMAELADVIWKWKELSDPSALERVVNPVESMLTHLPCITVKQSAVDSLRNGTVLNRPGVSHFSANISEADRVLLIDRNGNAIAIADALVSSEALLTMQQGPVAQPRQQLRG